ncbi:MAG: hypothetical protein ACYTFI_00280 [Planctomycetota bacterium]
MPAFVSLLLGGCGGVGLFTADGYLGLPDKEVYPSERFDPIQAVAEQDYFSISHVITVPYDEYEEARARGNTMYEATTGEFLYYSIEMDFDVEAGDGVRACVPVLERRRTAKP